MGKSKILILGGDGMIGSGLAKSLNSRYDIAITSRHLSSDLSPKTIQIYYGVDVRIIHSIVNVLNHFKPEIVINCVGLVKQKYTSERELDGTVLNSVFPYELSKLCDLNESKLILLSTDCVFSGKKGNYVEQDIPDAIDHYGRTKILGEILDNSNVLTIRTSTIGLEKNSNKGLIEWFLSQTGIVRGFSKAIYSGFTTAEFANVLSFIIDKYSSLHGLWHVSSEPLSKYELLAKLKEKLDKNDIEIQKEDEFNCDRSLNSSHFRNFTGYVPPSWDSMLSKLATEILIRRENYGK